MGRVETIGDAELHLGDCREVMGSWLETWGRIDCVVTDPPYGTGCAPRGGAKQGVIDTSTRQLPDWDILNFDWVRLIKCKCLAVFCAGKHAALTTFEIGGDNLLIYIKSNPNPMGSSFEAIVTRGLLCKSPQHIVAYNAFNGQEHETQKPLEVMQWCIQRLPPGNGGAIFDPFMGSGTTGVAALKLGRKFIGIEREPEYFDIACRRIEEVVRQPDMLHEIERQPVEQQAMAV